jgi:DNA polymerase-3 subunit alpha (Gram-positive type)
MINSYISFDIETTGLSYKKDEIIEIGAVKVENGEIIDKFESLICPTEPITSNVSELTGITNEMVADAPPISEVIPRFVEFVGDFALLGHNITTFDMRFVLKACQSLNIYMDNQIIDTLTLSRKILSQLTNHRLEDLCEVLNIENKNSHRALSDCTATHEIYQKLIAMNDDEIIAVSCSAPVVNDAPIVKKRKHAYTEETQSLQMLQGLLLGVTCDNILTESEVYALKNWLDSNRHLCGNYPFDRVERAISEALEDGILEQRELDEMLEIFKSLASPSFGTQEEIECVDIKDKQFCLSGEFERGSKNDVKKVIEDKGGIVKSSVSGKTTYLIVGGLGNENWKCGNYGDKIKTALELQDKGKPIQIIKEKDFWTMIGE